MSLKLRRLNMAVRPRFGKGSTAVVVYIPRSEAGAKRDLEGWRKDHVLVQPHGLDSSKLINRS